MLAGGSISISFVASLAQFLSARSVILLYGETDFDDADWSEAAWLSRELHQAGVLMARSVDEATRHAQLNEAGDTIIVDVDGLHGQVSDASIWSRESLHWLVPEDGDFSGPPADVRLDTNFYTVQSHDDSGNLTVKEWYGIMGILQGGPIGHWNMQDGLHIEVPVLYERRSNLHGLKFKGVTVANPAFMWKPEGADEYSGQLPNIMHRLESLSNFTVDWSESPDGQYGIRSSTGSWNGMIGVLQRGEADLAAAWITTSLERQSVVDFTHPYVVGKATLLIVNPLLFGTSDRINATAFLKVFTLTSWILIAASFIIIFAVHLAVCLTVDGKSSSLANAIFTSLSFAYTSFLQLDSPLVSTSRSNKILMLITAMFALIAMMYYEGMLTSFMTVQKRGVHFSSISDLFRHEYHIIVPNNTYYYADLAQAPPGTGKHLVFETMVKKNPKESICHTEPKCREILLNEPKVAYYGTEFAHLRNPDVLPQRQMIDALKDPIGKD